VADLTLNDNLYLAPSSSGAYYAAANSAMEPARRLLFRLMRDDSTPFLNESNLQSWTGADLDESLNLLLRVQSLGWAVGLSNQESAPSQPLEQLLPELLPKLSEEGKILLADNQGFYLTSIGFPHETAEELSALSADLASLYGRHSGLLQSNLGMPLQAWGMIDAVGNSQLGFWPLNIGEQRFVLVINGRPSFNQPAFKQLIWALTRRYADHQMFETQQ
jgi:hypothetical protein